MLIPRYLGGKSSDVKYPLWDGRYYDLLLSPFFGSGRQEVKGIQRGWARAMRCADSDPAVRAVVNEWIKGEASNIVAEVNSFIWPILDIYVDGPSGVFPQLKEIIDDRGEDVPNAVYAAAKILLHQFVHGGNVRCNNEGLLNVSPRTDKGEDWAEWLKDYSYELPWCPPNRDIQVFDDWEKVFHGVDPTLSIICLIDAPYSAPGPGQRSGGIGMSKAYANHGGSPNDPALLEMHKGAVLAAIDVGCDRIVSTNYHGHWLQQIEYDDDGIEHVVSQEWVQYQEITAFMEKQGFHFHGLGPLSGCTNLKPDPSKAGKRKQKAVRHEGWWEMGGVRQHGRYEQPNLLDLLEVAA